MSLPAPRDMPQVVATWSSIRKAWLIALPGGGELAVPNAQDVEPLVRKHLPSTVVRFERPA